MSGRGRGLIDFGGMAGTAGIAVLSSLQADASSGVIGNKAEISGHGCRVFAGSPRSMTARLKLQLLEVRLEMTFVSPWNPRWLQISNAIPDALQLLMSVEEGKTGCQ